MIRRAPFFSGFPGQVSVSVFSLGSIGVKGRYCHISEYPRREESVTASVIENLADFVSKLSNV